MERDQSHERRLLLGLIAQVDPAATLTGIVDEQGDIVDLRYLGVNDQACAFLGRSREELLGSTFLTLFPQHRESGLFGTFAGVLRTGTPIVWDQHAIDSVVVAPGTLFDLRAARVRDLLILSWRLPTAGADGPPTGDLSGEHEALIALERANDRLSELVDRSSDAVATGDNAGTITWVSGSTHSLTGWRDEDLVGRKFVDFVDPADRDVVAAAQSQVGHGTPVTFEARFRAAHGDYRWISFHVRPRHNERGEVTGRIVGWRDVHAARQALAHSEMRFRTTMDASPIGMAVIDAGRHLLVVNPSLCRLIGEPPHRLVLRRIDDVLDPLDRAGDAEARERLLAGDQTSAGAQRRLVHHDGHTVWVEHVIAVIRGDGGRPDGFVDQFLDISETMRAKGQG